MVPTKPRTQHHTEARSAARSEPPVEESADPAAPAAYERLRRHLGRPPLEHPVVGRPLAVAPAAPAAPAVPAAPLALGPSHPAPSVPRRAAAIPSAAPAPRLSVMDWLLALGHVVARRLRGAPRSAMVPLHPRK